MLNALTMQHLVLASVILLVDHADFMVGPASGSKFCNYNIKKARISGIRAFFDGSGLYSHIYDGYCLAEIQFNLGTINL